VYTLITGRGIGVVAILVGLLSAGCGGRNGLVAPRPETPAQAGPSSALSAPAFERSRAAWEQSVRQSTPAGFTIQLGSTYATKSGKLTYDEASVVMKTSRSIGFAVGSKYFVYDRNQLNEIPRTSILATPPGRRASGGRPICNPDAGDCGGGGPPPPPDPNPTDPADVTIDATGSTPDADRIALARSSACTHQMNNNGYPNSYIEWTNANTNTWTLHYTPGYPYYAGGSDNITGNTRVALVSGPFIDNMIPGTLAPENVDHTVSVIYRDDLRKVAYVAITLFDQVSTYNFTDTVYAEDRITCSNDTSLFVAPIPPGPTDPGPGNGNGTGWGSHVVRPQPPR